MHRIAAAIAAMMIAGTANAGPFGYNAGDEMPPAMEPEARAAFGLAYSMLPATGITNGGLPYVVVAPPEGFHSLIVAGTKRTGICMLRVFRLISNPQELESSTQAIENALRRKYGPHSNKLYGSTNWLVTDGDIAAISLTTKKEDVMAVIAIEYALSNITECLVEVNSGL